jgi:hypothetical protein
VIYLVTYDLGPSRGGVVSITRRHKFYQEFEESRSWWHFLDKTWLISTEETLEELDKRLRQHLGPTDKLLIVKFRGEYAGSLPSEAWEWIEERMSAGELVR